MKGLICSIGVFIKIVLSVLALFSSQLLAKELPAEYFSRLPQFQSPKLDAKGEQIAFILNHQENEISVLSHMDLATGKLSYLIKSDNEKIKFNWFKWANDKTLLVSVRYPDRRYNADTTETRLFAIDTRGNNKEPRLLVKPRVGGFRNNHFSQFQDNVIDLLPDDPEHVLISLDKDKPNMPSVYKLNIYSKKLERLEKGKRLIRDWQTDQQGRLRLGHTLSYKRGGAKILVRQPDDDQWMTLFEYNALEDPAIYAQGFDKDPNILYYSAYQDDMKTLFKIDLRTQKKEVVYHDPENDVSGHLIYSPKTREVVGISHINAPSRRIYWDQEYKVLQQGIDNALPNMDNYLVDFSHDENIYIVYSENDYTPGVYYIGNRKEHSLSVLFSKYPELKPELLTEHKLVTYQTRDGETIEGYLSLPKDHSGPIPTILHPHGGPGARDMDGFNYWTSFFVNRGYAVFRPNFRGSTGYGYEFAQKQMKSWGLEMQDDLTDAAHWLVKEKIADPQKMCIVGASYGGYAAAMAAVKTPDLFACAVSFAGVTDLDYLVSRASKYAHKKFVKKQIGTDWSDLKARSPYYHVKKVKTPILLVHGEKDRVVNVEHSRKMAEELEDHDKSFKYLELKNGDHYLSIQRNRHQLFSAMDDFLKQHLN